MSLQIDKNIDLVLVNLRSGFSIRNSGNIDEVVTCLSNIRAILAAVIRTVRICGDTKSVLVVRLKNASHQMRCGMVVKIRTEVANTYDSVFLCGHTCCERSYICSSIGERFTPGLRDRQVDRFIIATMDVIERWFRRDLIMRQRLGVECIDLL